jgi:hypothetical protein
MFRVSDVHSNPHLAPIRHGLTRIDEKIEKHLFKLVRHAPNRRNLTGCLNGQANALTLKARLDHAQRVGDQIG